MHPENSKYYYRCINCDQVLWPDRPYYTCSKCGGLLLVERDLDFLRSQFSTLANLRHHIDTVRSMPRNGYPWGSGVWQWISLILPGFPQEHILSLHEGNTDMWEPPNRLKEQIRLNRLLVKMEGQAPSGSFKDRGMPIAISDALRLQAMYPDLGIRFIACASTGDTSASAAKYAAYVRHLLHCIIMVAEGQISPAQMYQAIDAGAIVLALRADGFDTCMKVIQQFCANHPEIVLVNSKNAMRIVGQETISLEIWQDLGWKVPDWLVIPVGNGGNLTAQMTAWLLLKQLGFIDRLPGIIVAQTNCSNTIVRWINSDFRVYEPGQPGPTVASAMNIQNPVSFPRIELLHPEFQIVGFDVAEGEIGITRARFNRAGAGLCTQGAVTLNATLQAREAGVIKENDLVVAISTANDLKFVEAGVNHHQAASTQNFANRPLVVEATLKAVETTVAELLQEVK